MKSPIFFRVRVTTRQSPDPSLLFSPPAARGEFPGTPFALPPPLPRISITFLSYCTMSVKSEPVFVTVSSLRPGTANHNLRVKVVDAKTVVSRRRQDGSSLKISECLVGDSTGVITFTARNEQVDLLKPGSVVLLRNAKIGMFCSLAHTIPFVTSTHTHAHTTPHRHVQRIYASCGG